MCLAMRIGVVIGLTVLGHSDGEDAAYSQVKKTFKPYAVVASLPEKTFRVGMRIPLTCVFENRTFRRVDFWDRGFYINHLLVVRDEGGREAKLSEDGEYYRKLFRIDGPYSAVRIKVGGLSTHTSLCDNGVMNDLARLYRLTPGRYRVEIRLEEEREPAWNLKAEPVFFRIVD